MPDANQNQEVLIPDLHLGNLPAFAAQRLKVLAVVVLTLNEDGSIGFNGFGANHAKANEMLSVGIYMNLSSMYDAIRQGKAGQDAAAHLEAIEHFQPSGVPQ